MPIEATLLDGKPVPLEECPLCRGRISGESLFSGALHPAEVPFLRGMVQRFWRPWWAPWRTRPYCSFICPHCKNILGWEDPGGGFELRRKCRRLQEKSQGGPYR